jgi:hypothetical protein
MTPSPSIPNNIKPSLMGKSSCNTVPIVAVNEKDENKPPDPSDSQRLTDSTPPTPRGLPRGGIGPDRKHPSFSNKEQALLPICCCCRQAMGWQGARGLPSLPTNVCNIHLLHYLSISVDGRESLDVTTSRVCVCV